ncbi:hypothetical protein JOB18_027572 [Solea senegalensis]|uniref:Uncharacterized protein n=1 Tax=Solea senegalensis TaxID=28829 RepID=A0AAV6QV33_SOLSE|nr:hypothetical protein JOB18_027572 [Solea senegalensis]
MFCLIDDCPGSLSTTPTCWPRWTERVFARVKEGIVKRTRRRRKKSQESKDTHTRKGSLQWQSHINRTLLTVQNISLMIRMIEDQ